MPCATLAAREVPPRRQRGGQARMTGEGNAARTPGDALEAGTRGHPLGRGMLLPPFPPSVRDLVASRGRPR